MSIRESKIGREVRNSKALDLSVTYHKRTTFGTIKLKLIAVLELMRLQIALPQELLAALVTREVLTVLMALHVPPVA